MQTNPAQPRVAVFIKQVPSRTDAQMDPAQGTLLRVPGQSMLNPYDYAAIEAALDAARSLCCPVTAISMGPAAAEQVLREALALGASEAILLCDRAFAGADVFATGFTLARALRLTGLFSYVFCGQQTTDGDTAQLPFSLAAQLDIPAFGWIKSLTVRGDALELTQEYSGGTRKLRALPPCVFAMQSDSYPRRQATLMQTLQAAKRDVLRWDRAKLGESCHYGLSGSPTRVKRLYQAQQIRRTAPLTLPPKQAAARILSEIKAVRENRTQTVRIKPAPGVPAPRIHEHPLPLPPLVRTYTAQEAKRELLVFLQPRAEGLHPASLELAQQAAALAREGDSQAIGCTAIPAMTAQLREQLESCPLAQVDVYRTDAVPMQALPEEDWRMAALDCIQRHRPGSVLIAATPEGRALAPALGAKLQTGVTADCTALTLLPDGSLLQTRPAFGGDKMAEIITPQARPQIATVRRGALEGDFGQADTQPDGIWLVAGGGVAKKEEALRMQETARLAGLRLGCSRSLVERGWLPQSLQVGLSGQSIAPALLLCVGISGSVQFLAGIHAAKHVIAINSDENAAILRRADLPLVGDYRPIIEALIP